MYSSFLQMYQMLGAMSRTSTEIMNAQTTQVGSLVQESYRSWLDLMTGNVEESTKLVQDLAACRTPMDVAAVQRAFIETTGTRSITNLNRLMEITAVLVGGLTAAATKGPALLAAGATGVAEEAATTSAPAEKTAPVADTAPKTAEVPVAAAVVPTPAAPAAPAAASAPAAPATPAPAAAPKKAAGKAESTGTRGAAKRSSTRSARASKTETVAAEEAADNPFVAAALRQEQSE